MTRPNLYPYTKNQWEEVEATTYTLDGPAVFKELRSNNGKAVFDGRTFEFKTGDDEALNVDSGRMNARKLKGKEIRENDE